MFKKRAMARARWADELDNRSMKLTMSEGTVYGARYLTVLPIISQDMQAGNWNESWFNQTWHDMELWCNAQFGPTPNDGVWTHGARWYMNNAKFWFRDEADLSWFLLRWA